MNSEERHKLHTNELGEAIEEMPEILRKHWLAIGGIIVLIIVVLVSWTGLKHSIKTNQIKNQQALAKIVVSRNKSIVSSVGNDLNYHPASEAVSFRDMAAGNSSSPIGYNAAIQEGKTILSKLYFSKEYMTPEQKAEICQKAKDVFDAVGQKYSNNASAVCQSKIGLAAVATELGQYDEAEKLYNSILEHKDALASTAFPAMAEVRLAKLAEIKEVKDIDFPPAPEPEPALEPADTATPDTTVPEAVENAEEDTEVTDITIPESTEVTE